MADLSRAGKEPSWPEVFRRTREVAGLKQEDVVAAVLGLTQSTYSRFELDQATLELPTFLEIKNFLDKHKRKRIDGLTSLASLLPQKPESVSTTGKLTEDIAKELQGEYDRKIARELDRQLDEELPALRRRVAELEKEIALHKQYEERQYEEIQRLKRQSKHPKRKTGRKRRKK